MTPEGLLDVYHLTGRGPLDPVRPPRAQADAEDIGRVPATTTLTGEQPA